MGKIVVMGGNQWGDEGKGRLVHEYGEDADVVVRVAGGANSGHTQFVDGVKAVTHLAPSAVSHPRVRCFLGNDMVIDALAFQQEITDLGDKGFLRCQQLGVSRLAQLVMPYCLDLEKFREQARGKAAIGTTGRGIGTTYEMQVRRLGLRVTDLLHLEQIRPYVQIILNEINPELAHWGGQPYTVEDIMAFLEQAKQILQTYILKEPLSKIITQAKASQQNVLIELAQGPGLDKTHGTYPYVTSSCTLAGGACSGAGIGPTLIDEVIGVTKAYCTRVGGGPFPTELEGDLAEEIRERGQEYGASTGRPRRVGWHDGPQTRGASRVGGLTGLVITKGDVLRGIHTRVCDYYLLGERIIRDLDELDAYELSEVRPHFQEMGSFDEDISGCRTFEDLPKAAQKHYRTIGEMAGVPLVAISVGQHKGQTIMLKNIWQ
jgi:adenylosuccinate synthase